MYFTLLKTDVLNVLGTMCSVLKVIPFADHGRFLAGTKHLLRDRDSTFCLVSPVENLDGGVLVVGAFCAVENCLIACCECCV